MMQENKSEVVRLRQQITLDNTNNAFCLYLERYHLSVEAVARMAGVPMMTVWRIRRGEPIGRAKLARVRLGLYQLTGVAYVGSIATLVEENSTTNLRRTRLRKIERGVR